MKSKKFDPALMLRVQVLEAERRYKSAETWQHRGDWPYKLFCVLFIISAVFILFINLIIIFGTLLEISNINENLSDMANAGKQLAIYRNNLTITSVLTFLTVAALILFIFRKFLIPVIFSIISAIASNVFFYTLLKNNNENSSQVTEINGFMNKYLLCHLIPAIVFVVAILIVFLIVFRDKRILLREYNKASVRIYQIHDKRLEEKGEKHRLMSPDEWKELVAEYISGELGSKQKRSKKDKKRKEKPDISDSEAKKD